MTTDFKVGAIFPILPEHTPKLFEEGQSVFVKFTKLQLDKGMIIAFYVSGRRNIVGQGTITNIEKMRPKEVWTKYGNKIFLTKREYDSYVRISSISGEERKSKKITAFVLKDLKKYEKPVIPTRYVTPAGRYLYRRTKSGSENDFSV